jgi:hypothetical protein
MSQQPPRPTGYNNPRTLFALVEFLAAQFAKTIVVFFRWDFGERYFNISDFLGSVFTFLIVAGVILFILASGRGGEIAREAGGAEQNSWALIIFLICFLVMSLYHRFIAWLQKQGGRHRWHSRYPGTSFLRVLTVLPFVNTYTVQRFIEPVIAIVAGSIIFSLTQPLGAWLIFAGLCLAATENFAYRRARNRLLDTIDAQIESKHLGDAISGTKTIKETEGFVLPVPTYFSKTQRARLAEGMRQLDPGLQAIMDVPEEGRPTSEITDHTQMSKRGRQEGLDPALQALLDTPEDT